MGFYLSIIVIVLCIVLSLRELFIPDKIKGKKMSIENFIILTIIYATVMISFGLIYFLVGLEGHHVMSEGEYSKNTSSDTSLNTISKLETCLYFSAITLFSVGYGDIAPVGIGRIIAVSEALIGYTIPTAFVARAVFDRKG